MITGFGNNVVSSLASDITAGQTTIPVMPGAGALFAGLLSSDYNNPSNTLSTYAKLTLTDSKETSFEVCHLLSVSGDVLTVIREQEGTVAKGWSLNDVIANFATRGSENQFVQIDHLQSGFYCAGVAEGSANALMLHLPSSFFVNGSTDWMLRTPVIVYPTQDNTGAATLQLVLGGVALGTFPLYKGDKADLVAGDILEDVALACVLDKSQTFFSVMNPGAIHAGLVLSVNTHGPDASGNVKLGTAADADVQTSQNDTTLGRLIPSGNYGLAPSLPAATGVDLDTLQTYGLRIVSNVKNGPFNGDIGAMFIYVSTWQSGTGTAGYRITQEAIGYGQSASTANRVARRSFNGTVWTGWQEFYSQAHKPTAQDTGALPLTGGTCTGQVIAPNFASTPNVTPVGAGTYAEQLGNQAPFFQPNWQWSVNSGGIFVPIAKGTSTRKDKGWPTAVSYGYLMPGEDKHSRPVIHALGDGGQESVWEFNTQTGGIHSKAGEFATLDQDIPPGIIHAWPSDTPPPGWLLCNGSGFSPSFCPLLARVFPSGQVPDLRGVFLRAKDNGKGYDPNRELGSLQAGQAPASAIGGGEWAGYAGRDTGHTSTTGTDNSGNYRVMQETEAQRETRPVNVSVNYIVRAA